MPERARVWSRPPGGYSGGAPLDSHHESHGARPGSARSELAAVRDDHGRGGLAGLGAHGLDLLHHVHALAHLAEDAVLPVEPRRLHRAEEELRAVRVRARVRHGEDAGAGVLQREVLVGELGAVDGLAAGAVAGGEVAALAHEVGDHAVEGAALEVERLAHLARALLAGAEGAEVLRGLGRDVGPELHGDAAGRGAADGHVEEDLGVGHLELRVCVSEESC
mmetsp:Transcript_31747/g.94331  ORF Transcript_31747/g.94331 Transcript_31747/m.94331 type:complete len:221 (+) Transcript_31747:184-846(+)